MAPPALYAHDKAVSMEAFFAEADLLSLQGMHLFVFSDKS